MRDFSYVPIIKTTDSEIKGYSNLSSDVKNEILPVFELTRSRPVKAFPTGDVHKRMEQLREYTEGNPFILDLTSHEDLANEQIEALSDDTNGFQEWRNFLRLYNDINIIPMIHLYPDDLDTCVEFLEISKGQYNFFAFRISVETTTEECEKYLEVINSVIDISKKLIFIIDCDYVDERNFSERLKQAGDILVLAEDKSIYKVSVNSSSFPSSVRDRLGAEDSEGCFEMLEVKFYNAVKSECLFDICYGDYAGIHPIRRTIAGGNWVPRVDFVRPYEYLYKRFRREDGGYKRAASEVVLWSEFNPAYTCWGIDQIREAANSEPPGKSPSFWITVRLNIHITFISSVSTLS